MPGTRDAGRCVGIVLPSGYGQVLRQRQSSGLQNAGLVGHTATVIRTRRGDLEQTANLVVGCTEHHCIARSREQDHLPASIADDLNTGEPTQLGCRECVGGGLSQRIIESVKTRRTVSVAKDPRSRCHQITIGVHAQRDNAVQLDHIGCSDVTRSSATDEVVCRRAGTVDRSAGLEGSANLEVSVLLLADRGASREVEVTGHQGVVQHSASAVAIVDGDVTTGRVGSRIDSQIAIDIHRSSQATAVRISRLLGQQATDRQRHIRGSCSVRDAQNAEVASRHLPNLHAIGVSEHQAGIARQQCGQDIYIIALVQGYVAG